MSCFDVVVVGGGPMGLAAAYECSVKLGKRVLVLEQLGEFANEYGSSPGYSRQFRISYSEENLCELAIETSPMWNTLMKEMKNPNLLQRTGCLWFGDPSVENSEGNIDQAADNLRKLGQKEPEDFEVLEGEDEILNDERFSFVSKAVEEIDGTPKALFTKDGGTVNVPDLVKCYIGALQGSGKATLVKNARVTKIDYSKETIIDVVALINGKDQSYQGEKVIMTPGTYVNDALATLVPLYTRQINLAIYLWSSTYFKTFQDSGDVPSNPSQWPIWYFFGKAKLDDGDNHEGHIHDYNAYYGFPSEPQRPNFLRVAPAFTSQEEFDFQDYPPAPEKEKRPVDEDAMKFTSEFVKQYMPDLSPHLIDSEKTTCVAGFAELLNPSDDQEDNSAGFVLDSLVQKRIVLFTGGWGMKYVPMIGKILTDLVICGNTEYQKLIEPLNINRGILKPVETSRGKREEKRVKLSAAMRAAKFNKIWC